MFFFIIRLRVRVACCFTLNVRLVGVFFISSLKATLHVDTALCHQSTHLTTLSAQGFPSDSVQIIVHALILSNVQ